MGVGRGNKKVRGRVAVQLSPWRGTVVLNNDGPGAIELKTVSIL
jgi:hypothetical protein